MKRCTPAAAAASFSLILAVPALLLHLGADAAMAVFAAAAVSTAAAMALGVPWGEIEETILRVVADCIPTLLIVILVGMLVGIWMAVGTVPALLYYGVRLIAPGTLVPLAFLLCLLCAEFTGTSFGSVAAMGLTMAGVAATTSVPPALVAGAVVSGAWFGDKMSPLSDTTNLASAVSRVPLYDHIGSMAYTSLPAAALSLVLFTLAGLGWSGGELDTGQAQTICAVLEAHFNLSPLLLLPAVLVLLVSLWRLPAVLGLGLTVAASAVFALVSQPIGLTALLDAAAKGFSISTGSALVDRMLCRGGIASMADLLVTCILAGVMGGVIAAAGILDVLAREVLLRFIHRRGPLIAAALVYCYLVSFLTAGSQTVAIIMTQQTFAAAFDRLDIHPKVLSRTLEDAGTLSAPIVPWGPSAGFVMSTLGCGLEYIPYCWFIFLVPLFSLLCAATGLGVWDREGRPLRRQQKILVRLF